MFNRLITWAIIVALAYFLLSRAVPWLEDRFGTPRNGTEPPTASGAAECVDRAAWANEALVDAARRFGRPPVEINAWSDAVWEVENGLQAAESACRCLSEACDKAGRALSEMRSQLSELDQLVRGDARGLGNPARRQERIVALLQEARALAHR